MIIEQLLCDEFVIQKILLGEMTENCRHILSLIDNASRNLQFEECREDLFFASTFSRFRNLLDATVVLSENDLVKEAAIISRSIYEICFKVKAVKNDTNLIDQVIVEQLITKKKRIKKFLDGKLKTDKSNLEILRKELEKVESEIAEANLNGLGKNKWAEKADLKGTYLTTYDILCDFSHISASDLDSLLMINDGKVDRVIFGRDSEEKDTIMFYTALISTELLAVFCDYFEIDLRSEIDELRAQFERRIQES